MRHRVVNDGLSVHAIAGTEVVLFGLDLPKPGERNSWVRLRAYRRSHTAAAAAQGLKTFAATEPADHQPGQPVSTLEHPVQAFLWGDYLVDPGGLHLSGGRLRWHTGAPYRHLPRSWCQCRPKRHGKRPRHLLQSGSSRIPGLRAAIPETPSRRCDQSRAWKWLSRGLEEALFASSARRGRRPARAAALRVPVSGRTRRLPPPPAIAEWTSASWSTRSGTTKGRRKWRAPRRAERGATCGDCRRRD